MHNYFHFNEITCGGEKASLENYQVAFNYFYMKDLKLV